MNIGSITEALSAMTNDLSNRSQIGQLRAAFPLIEQAQQMGVKNKRIVDELKRIGMNISQGAFETMLYRIRKEKKRNAVKKQTTVTAQTQPLEERSSIKSANNGNPLKSLSGTRGPDQFSPIPAVRIEFDTEE